MSCPHRSSVYSVLMHRRAFLASLSAAAAPANSNVKWALSAALWSHFRPVPFTEILDIMKDTGFIGIRLTGFPGVLKTYNLTAAQMEREVAKRGLHVVTISFTAPSHDPAQRAKVLAGAKEAMQFLSGFGAKHLVVFPPNRSAPGANSPVAFEELCARCNQIGEAAGEMGFTAGLHNHLNQMVESPAEVHRAMSLTNPKLFSFSPDTAHLHLAGGNVPEFLEKYKSRIRFMDYKDAKWTTPAADWVEDNGKIYPKDSREAKFLASIYDFRRWRDRLPRLPPHSQERELQRLALRRPRLRAQRPARQLRTLRRLRRLPPGAHLQMTRRHLLAGALAMNQKPKYRIVDPHVHVWDQTPALPVGQGNRQPAQGRSNAGNAARIDEGERRREDGAGAVHRLPLGQQLRRRYREEVPPHTSRASRASIPPTPASPDHLSHLVAQGFRGVRLSPSAKPDGDWIEGPLMPPLWKRAEALQTPMLLLTSTTRLPAVARLIERHPALTVVIDHMADCPVDQPRELDKLLALARYPKVFVKISHIVVALEAAVPVPRRAGDGQARVRRLRPTPTHVVAPTGL